jgi:hypothetical protein
MPGAPHLDSEMWDSKPPGRFTLIPPPMPGAPHLDFEMWDSKNPGRPTLFPPPKLGAPHLDFETWESTKLSRHGPKYSDLRSNYNRLQTHLPAPASSPAEANSASLSAPSAQSSGQTNRPPPCKIRAAEGAVPRSAQEGPSTFGPTFPSTKGEIELR